MKCNMGAADRIVRLLFTLVVVVLLLTRTISGLAAVILGIIALIFLVTSLIGFCPLYVPLKISTRRNKE